MFPFKRSYIFSTELAGIFDKVKCKQYLTQFSKGCILLNMSIFGGGDLNSALPEFYQRELAIYLSHVFLN